MCALILIAININYSIKHSSKEQSGLSLALLNHQPLYKENQTGPSSVPASFFFTNPNWVPRLIIQKNPTKVNGKEFGASVFTKILL